MALQRAARRAATGIPGRRADGLCGALSRSQLFEDELAGVSVRACAGVGHAIPARRASTSFTQSGGSRGGA
jgi:hypothetical protein